MLLSLKLLIAILGLTLPGFLLGRVLKLKAAGAVAFPFSALLLTQLVICFSVLGIPLRFDTMALSLSAWLVLNCLVLRFRPATPVETATIDKTDLPGWLANGCVATALLIVLAVTFRTTLYPLSGYDTFFRWEAVSPAHAALPVFEFLPACQCT